MQNYWFKNIKNKLKQSSVNLVYRAPPLASEGVSTSETKFKAINSSSWSSGTSLKASIETAVPCPSLFRPIFLGIKDRPSFRSRSEEVARLHFLKSGKSKKSTDIVQIYYSEKIFLYTCSITIIQGYRNKYNLMKRPSGSCDKGLWFWTIWKIFYHFKKPFQEFELLPGVFNLHYVNW